MNQKEKQKVNSRSKAPAFQFYASDWLTDPSLRICSLMTRGIWIDLLCFMHLSSEPGYLIINGQPLTSEGVRQFTNCDKKTFKKIWNELVTNGIIKQDNRGVYYSKRMVEDQRLKEIRRNCGYLGGNPKLINLVDNLDKQKLNQKQTPSSSSSSSSSEDNIENEKKLFVDHLISDFIEKNCPNVKKLKKQITLEQCNDLEINFGIQKTLEILTLMENFKSLGAKYVSVYLTALNWLKRAKNDNNSNNNKPGNGKVDFTTAIHKF